MTNQVDGLITCPMEEQIKEIKKTHCEKGLHLYNIDFTKCVICRQNAKWIEELK